MKKVLLLYICIVCCTSICAQKLSVESFVQTDDAIASTRNITGTDGKTCAAIVVRIPISNASFEGGFIIGHPTYRNGEYIIDMQQGAAQMRVSVPGYNTIDVKFRDYIGSTLKTKTTYLLTINVPQIYGIQHDDGMTYFSMTVTPANAQVILDGNLVMLDTDGMMIQRLKRGNHNYSVSSAGYSTVTQSFTLGTERQNATVNLKSELATLSISTMSPGIEIFVNDQYKGTNSWSGQLIPGNYVVEGRQKDYHNYQQTITLMEHQEMKMSIPALVGRTGQLDVAYKPIEAEVWIDGKMYGVTPDVFKDIIVGKHKVSISKSGYKTKDVTVTVNECQTTTLSGSLESVASTSVTNTAIVTTDHEWVDLGLSVLWATCNVGAIQPEEKGNFFAWGEKGEKEQYGWNSYTWYSEAVKDITKYTNQEGVNIADNKNILDLADDVSHFLWRKNWRMPSQYEYEELKTKCTWTWTSINGVNGYVVKSKKNGNQIFLPVSGCRIDKETQKYNDGFYWSSSLSSYAPSKANILHFNKQTVEIRSQSRIIGCMVRPVFDQIALGDEMENGHSFVDLGLSVKWATCNIGAKSPDNVGAFFSWGEVMEKSWYDWSTYFDIKDDRQDCKKYSRMSTFLSLESMDDVAHMKWGGKWRMPTVEEFNELREKCIWTYTTINGQNGYRVKSMVNENLIFLPLGGVAVSDSYTLKNKQGNYWSSSLDDTEAISAFILNLKSNSVKINTMHKMFGASARPVCP